MHFYSFIKIKCNANYKRTEHVLHRFSIINNGNISGGPWETIKKKEETIILVSERGLLCVLLSYYILIK